MACGAVETFSPQFARLMSSSLALNWAEKEVEDTGSGAGKTGEQASLLFSPSPLPSPRSTAPSLAQLPPPPTISARRLWARSSLILVSEFLERLSFYSIYANLYLFMTSQMVRLLRPLIH